MSQQTDSKASNEGIPVVGPTITKEDVIRGAFIRNERVLEVLSHE